MAANISSCSDGVIPTLPWLRSSMYIWSSAVSPAMTVSMPSLRMSPVSR